MLTRRKKLEQKIYTLHVAVSWNEGVVALFSFREADSPIVWIHRMCIGLQSTGKRGLAALGSFREPIVGIDKTCIGLQSTGKWGLVALGSFREADSPIVGIDNACIDL